MQEKDGRIFVTSDIHGEYDKFKELLIKIDFKEKDTLYVIGDVVDRGDNPMDIIKHIMNSSNIELILGNHEDMFLQYLDAKRKGKYEEEYIKGMWAKNGGCSTISDYDKLSASEQLEIEEFIRTRPLFKVVDKYILTHSGFMPYPIGENETVIDYLNSQSEQDLLWSRAEFYTKPALKGYTVIFGHTPTIYIYKECEDTEIEELKIWKDTKHNDKIGIDCGAVFGANYGGSLACICLDTLEEFYA